MTFSMIARCPETGAFGGVVGTSALAVGNRCLRVSHRRGAFLSQHRTDSRLGDRGIALLDKGLSADDAIAQVVAGAPDIEWRQLAALDAEGRAAIYHGRRMYSIYSHSIGKDCVAIGNILANDRITDAMVAAFEAAPQAALERRLVQALAAGRDAGGEILEPLHSAALRVTGPHGIDRCDLRVDSAGEAVAALEALLAAYGDQEEILRLVALEPDSVSVSRALFEASIERIAELGLEERFPTARRRDSWTLRD
ncbi:Uncharacterized conserved protein, Ntn-hydrolase superfamily [Tistlia consotensis]|uniref:Uncharacterized conserved protein, Ntn-hydrolase superfamily n=1 Tax=Tistlia consotensis USBA 355 TaxID=560819 RepID=A0A1Y6B530_9PROT|nr:DUF1028 domain-containing protein [Tistlia consotensis]SME92642.1 Uncharacterized conserved protein, Ntn-hydrolase superfamily [Tistlia consotensis USBA 355]SNR28155.1 Uncharacterized conserved protein, Ntn-hydrolase superfamily [Tistlia consotensis]